MHVRTYSSTNKPNCTAAAHSYMYIVPINRGPSGKRFPQATAENTILVLLQTIHRSYSINYYQQSQWNTHWYMQLAD